MAMVVNARDCGVVQSDCRQCVDLCSKRSIAYAHLCSYPVLLRTLERSHENSLGSFAISPHSRLASSTASLSALAAMASRLISASRSRWSISLFIGLVFESDIRERPNQSHPSENSSPEQKPRTAGRFQSSVNPIIWQSAAEFVGRKYLAKAKQYEQRAKKVCDLKDSEWHLTLARAYRVLAEAEKERHLPQAA